MINKVYEPEIRAFLGNAAHLCEVVDLKLTAIAYYSLPRFFNRWSSLLFILVSIVADSIMYFRSITAGVMSASFSFHNFTTSASTLTPSSYRRGQLTSKLDPVAGFGVLLPLTDISKRRHVHRLFLSGLRGVCGT